MCSFHCFHIQCCLKGYLWNTTSEQNLKSQRRPTTPTQLRPLSCFVIGCFSLLCAAKLISPLLAPPQKNVFWRSHKTLVQGFPKQRVRRREGSFWLWAEGLGITVISAMCSHSWTIRTACASFQVTSSPNWSGFRDNRLIFLEGMMTNRRWGFHPTLSLSGLRSKPAAKFWNLDISDYIWSQAIACDWNECECPQSHTLF